MKASDKGQKMPQWNTVQVVIKITRDYAKVPPKWEKPLIGVNSIDDVNNLEVNENATANDMLPMSFKATYSNGAKTLVYLLVTGRTPQENSMGNFKYKTDNGNMSIFIGNSLDYRIVTNFILKLRVSVLGVRCYYQAVRNNQQINVVILYLWYCKFVIFS